MVLMVLLPIISFGQAGIDTSYVCDTCDNGGIGYTTWALFESGENRDLVSADTAVIGIRADDSATTSHASNFQINGWTLDATRNLTMFHFNSQ